MELTQPTDKPLKEFNLNSQNEKNVINCIRWLTRSQKNNPNYIFTKNDIATILDIQWATVTNIIKNFKDSALKVSSDEKKIQLNDKAEYYIGVSSGSSRVKLVCLDFNFEPLVLNKEIKEVIRDYLKNYIGFIDNSEEINSNLNSDPIIDKLDEIKNFELCFNINSPKDMSVSIFNILNDICQLVVTLKKHLNIGSVGFAFPGVIDYDAKQIKSSYLLSNMNDLSLKDLIDEKVYAEFVKTFKSSDGETENYIFDKNSNAACVAEKELGNVARALQGKDNLLVIYGGYGYGVGLVLNNKLFMGTKRGGQLGHIQVTPYNISENQKQNLTMPCRCGKIHCLENRINIDVFGKGFDNISEEDFRSKSINDLCNILQTNKYNEKLTLSNYLCQAIYTLSQLFGAENVVLTSKLTKFYDVIQNEFKNMLFTQYSINPQNVKPSILGEFSAAKGIAIESYYYKYKMPLEWK